MQKKFSFLVPIFLLLINLDISAQGFWVPRANYTGTYLPPMAPSMQFQTFSIGNKGYIIPNGAENSGPDMFEYDVVTNVWTARGKVPEANYPQPSPQPKWRQYGTAFSANGKGYIGCGNTSSFNVTADFFEFNPATNLWTQRANFGGGARSGTVGGGNSSNGFLGFGGNYLSDWYRYNPGSNTWTAIASLPAANGEFTDRLGTFTYNDKIYVMINKTSGTEIWEYDPTLNSWALRSTLAQPPKYYFTINGKAIMAAGNPSGWSAFDLTNFTWSHGITPPSTFWEGFSIAGRGFILGSSNDFYEYIMQDIIPGTIPSNVLCPGTNFNLSYTINGTFNGGNVFNAELSDASGSFASPTIIGSTTSTGSGTINVTIPLGTPAGSAYRIRISSTSPAMAGFNNGFDISINVPPPTPSICLVTVDTASTHNIMYWDKTSFVGTSVVGFVPHREVTPNVYVPIDTVSIDSLSEWHDIGFGANPNITTYRYKLATIDSCGVMSALSLYHNTIFVVDGGGTFTYNLYEIESSANPVNNYVLYRDNISNNTWSVVGFTSGTQSVLNDPAYATYSSTGRWRVETLWAITCDPTRTTINTTRSNIKGSALIGIDENYLSSMIQLSPNPSSGIVNVALPVLKESVSLMLYNSVGQIVYNKTSSLQLETIDVEEFAKGVYTVAIQTQYGNVYKKLIIQ